MAIVNFPFNHFHMKDLKEFRETAARQGYNIPVSEGLEPLARPVSLKGRELANAIAIQPLEGLDGCADGSPSELTMVRYEKLAAQGAGILWVEATAVCPEGRDSQRQLWLHEGSRDGFRALVQRIDAAADAAGRPRPYKVIQLTHSGRCSKDAAGRPAPMAAFESPYLDPVMGKPQIVSDEYLDQLQVQTANAAGLAAEAGFDAVELKLCHQYLFKELLCAYTRDGRYGGSQQNRFRFALETTDKMRAKMPASTDIVVRLNVYDGIPWPYGWGMEPAGSSAGIRYTCSSGRPESNWQGNPIFEGVSDAQRSSWQGNPGFEGISDAQKSSWQGNPGFEGISDAQRSSWQGNPGFAQAPAEVKTNWPGNPAPLKTSDAEKSPWQGNPVRESIEGSSPSNWQGNPQLQRTWQRNDPDGSGDLSAEHCGAGAMRPDLTEVRELMKQLYQKGVRLFNLTTTSPRFAPAGNGYMDNFRESVIVNPYEGETALLKATREIRQSMPPDIRIVGTGLSWFGPYSANVAAGGITDGWFDIAGFGRSVMTNNDFIPSIMRGVSPDPAGACMGCDSCFRLFFADLPTGCAIHRNAYKDLFKKALAEGKIETNVIY